MFNLIERISKWKNKDVADGFSSPKYWEKRYESGGNSGDGSSGKLAKFKANTINTFVRDYNIETVLELGCGDGEQLRRYYFDKYIGVDVSNTALNICKGKYKEDSSKVFLRFDEVCDTEKTDLAISVDVIYHLVETERYEEYMCLLFSMAQKYVLIYSSMFNCTPKNTPHIRHHHFLSWFGKNVATEWKLIKVIPNEFPNSDINQQEDGTTFADFYIFSKKELDEVS